MVNQISGPANAKGDKKFDVFLARAEYFYSRVGVDEVHAVILAHHYTDRGIGDPGPDTTDSALVAYLRTFGSWSAVASIKPVIASLYKEGYAGISGGTANTSPIDRLSALSGHYHSGQLKVAHLLILTHFYATDGTIAAVATRMGKSEVHQARPTWLKLVLNAGLRFGGFGVSDLLLRRLIGWVEINLDGEIFDGYVNKHIADAG